MHDLMGLSANLIDTNFKKRIVVIGMSKMPGPHNAENIKIAIESIVNTYYFDKRKIKGEPGSLFFKF
jgi:hypothetical protein